MRCITYHRVSTTEQDTSNASAELRGAVARMGGELVAEITEVGSGSRNNRPGLRQLMDLVRRGQVDAVLVWKLDRFGRSVLDLLANVRILSDAGVTFIATSQSITIRPKGDALSNLLVTMLAGIAEFERTLIVERTRLGLARARREGTKSGKPFGRPRAVDKPTPAAVRRLRAAGKSWSEVAVELGCSIGRARRRAAVVA